MFKSQVLKKFKMKLFKGAFFATTFLSPDQANAENMCDVSELDVPAKAIGWDCDENLDGINANNLVPPGTMCWLKCEPRYIDYICK